MDASRRGRYERILVQLTDLVEGKSPSLLAAMATINAVLHAKMRHHFWTGFYFVHGQNEQHVGPYQGAVACQVLRDGGVCIEAAKTRAPVVVPDVEAFPGHIACDVRSKSEIAIPLFWEDDVVAVFDVDSESLDAFTEEDVEPLRRILALLDPFLGE